MIKSFNTHKTILKSLKTFVIILVLFASNTSAMNKTLKGALIGLGTGLVIGSTVAFCNTYYFKEGYFTSDAMTSFGYWGIIAPSITGVSGITGGIIGYHYQKKENALRQSYYSKENASKHLCQTDKTIETIMIPQPLFMSTIMSEYEN
jgi:hypothetical protein